MNRIQELNRSPVSFRVSLVEEGILRATWSSDKIQLRIQKTTKAINPCGFNIYKWWG